MASMVRDNRRRRVLNEEVRTASGASVASTGSAAAEAPRYGEQANIEHHPQITDFVPRRKRAVLVTLSCAAGVAAASQLAVHFSPAIVARVPGATPQDVADRIAGGIVAWASAVAMLLVAALARITFSLRRHRLDDVGGRYRVWRWIAAGAILASVNAVVGAHGVFARAAAALTGWSLTASAAEWWIAPLVLVGGWIALRLVFEIAESRSALATTLLAGALYAAAIAGALGWAPAALGPWTGVLAGALPLMGHAVVLVAMMIFARYVVLDVQGLVEHKPRRQRAPKPRKAKAPADDQPTAPTGAPSNPAAASSTSDDEEDDEEDDADGDRYLSKSERKRLRKQQQRQSRAA